ncbi:MAG: hypothetical protein JGK08_16040 [Microcoleus sp. PH2017_04_SCI_O_A]|nr:hypothetical protein [Microcoleus sp. PH2017_04_SCI_O_A]
MARNRVYCQKELVYTRNTCREKLKSDYSLTLILFFLLSTVNCQLSTVN